MRYEIAQAWATPTNSINMLFTARNLSHLLTYNLQDRVPENITTLWENTSVLFFVSTNTLVLNTTVLEHRHIYTHAHRYTYTK